jgi:hypothetical protein
MRPRGSRRTRRICNFCDWHHIATGRISERINPSRSQLIQAAASNEPLTTIRTPSEMDSSVSMGGRNVARVARRDVPGVRRSHHRNTCQCCACWISGACHACQRQGCELKKLMRCLPMRRGGSRRTSPSCWSYWAKRLRRAGSDVRFWG